MHGLEELHGLLLEKAEEFTSGKKSPSVFQTRLIRTTHLVLQIPWKNGWMVPCGLGRFGSRFSGVPDPTLQGRPLHHQTPCREEELGGPCWEPTLPAEGLSIFCRPAGPQLDSLACIPFTVLLKSQQGNFISLCQFPSTPLPFSLPTTPVPFVIFGK